jgi:hypothetical protein
LRNNIIVDFASTFLLLSSRIPKQVRQDVLTLWMQGCRRDEIAKKVGIGTGTVSEILKEYRRNDSDFDHVREYVTSVMKTGLTVDQLACATRLNYRLEKLHLSPEQVELFVDNINEFCFLKGIEVEEFIKNVNQVSELSSKSLIPLEALSDHIKEKQREASSLGWEITFKKIERERTLREHNLTEIQLQEFSETGTIERLRTSEGALAEITKERNDAYKEICRLKVRLTWAEYAKKIVLDELIETRRKEARGDSNQDKKSTEIANENGN